MAEQAEAGAFAFKKKRPQRPLARKRPGGSRSSSSGSDGESPRLSNPTATKATRTGPRRLAGGGSSLLVAASTSASSSGGAGGQRLEASWRTAQQDGEGTLFVPFKASGTAASLGHDMATRTLDVDGADEHKGPGRGAGEGEEGGVVPPPGDDDARDVYAGLHGYKEFVNKRIANPTQITAGGLRAGPLKGQSNVRISVRFDYAPDICKDYKETGYCGFGDSCKFMHDRSEYKGSWLLDKEWDEKQRKAQIPAYLEGAEGAAAPGEDAEEKPDPFVCPICKRVLRQPVRTKCGHDFCERCALKRFVKTQLCFTCGTGTGGIFVPAPKDFREQLAAHLATLASATELKTLDTPSTTTTS